MAKEQVTPKHRALRDLGREVEVVNFSYDGGTNEYGDPTGFTGSTTTTYALVEQSQDPEQIGGADGSDLQTEVRIFLPSDVTVKKAGENDHEAVKATRIKDPTYGKNWKVYEVWHDNTGVIMTLCRTE